MPSDPYSFVLDHGEDRTAPTTPSSHTQWPLIERGGHRPSIRRAMRRWMTDRYAAGDKPDAIHNSALLLTAVVHMFEGWRGSLPSERVQNLIKNRYSDAYRCVIYGPQFQKRWNAFILSCAPVLSLHEAPHPIIEDSPTWRIVLICRGQGSIFIVVRFMTRMHVLYGLDGWIPARDFEVCSAVDAAFFRGRECALRELIDYVARLLVNHTDTDDRDGEGAFASVPVASLIPDIDAHIANHSDVFAPIFCAGLLSTRIQIDRTVQRLIRSQPDRFVIDGCGPQAMVALRDISSSPYSDPSLHHA